eukprot:CAMPEP_0118657046 /NCGR_PEP_ID=MMETSP0785-20121206/13803_1 /TAXON_ID=91992 /ORGANISM="Bolidomonas pacifica, Strain CCMP 1866" /LENGTH=1563 /DNA_ID=CAMNT_0006549925 /DNA_START=1 /DNA_END=4689 /DNA_ORIENTATION=-
MMKITSFLLLLASAAATEEIKLPLPVKTSSPSTHEAIKAPHNTESNSNPSPSFLSSASQNRAEYMRSLTSIPSPGSSEEKALLNVALGANTAILQYLTSPSESSLPSDACSDRIGAVRGLVEAGLYIDALTVSAALTSQDRAKLKGCEMEEFYDGLGSLNVRISMIPPSSSEIKSFLSIPTHSGALTMLSYGDRTFPMSHDDIPVHGFVLDGKFVASDSAVRCLSSREKEQQSTSSDALLCHTGFSLKTYASKEEAEQAANVELIESMSKGSVEEYEIGPDGERKLNYDDGKIEFGVGGESYALGHKRHIVFIACLEDETDPAFCNGGFDDIFEEGAKWTTMRDNPMTNPDGLSAFELNLIETMQNVTDFYSTQTYGQMTIEHHYIPQMFTLTKAEHGASKQTCLDADIVGTVLDSVKETVAADPVSFGVPSEFHAPDNFIIIVPNCLEDIYGGWAGIAYVGHPGSALRWMGDHWGGGEDNVYKDCSVWAHEVGHNFGCYHDSFGSVEYGSPFSVMGGGPIPEAHFMGAGKAIFEWMEKAQPGSEKTIGSMENERCKHNIHCEAFELGEKVTVHLQPIDDGQLDGDGTPALIRIPTDKANHYYFIEWRTRYDGGSNMLQVNPGPLIYFATTYARSSDLSDGIGFYTGTGSLGPTNIVHVYDSSSPSEWSYFTDLSPSDFSEVLTDAPLPMGETYVLDLDEVGLIITVKDIIVDHRMTLEFEFTERGSSSHMDSQPTNELFCGQTGDIQPGLNHLMLDASFGNETLKVEVEDTFYCDDADAADGVDLYVYTEFPLHIFPPYNADKLIDAVSYTHYDCPSTNTVDGPDLSSYCTDEGFCLNTGYGNVDACDYFQAPADDAEPKSYKSSNGNVICFRDQDSKWVVGTSCFSTYGLIEKACDWTWDNHGGAGNLQQVMLDCFDGVTGECNNLPGPTSDSCATNGMCINIGHTMFDVCDFFPVDIDSQASGTKMFYSETADMVIRYRGGGSWDIGIRDGGSYLFYNCGLTWGDASSMSMAEVFNQCFLPNLQQGIGTENLGGMPFPDAGGAYCNTKGIRVFLGDKSTYQDRIWDHMSKEVFIYADKNPTVPVTIDCSRPHRACSSGQLWDENMQTCMGCSQGGYELNTGDDRCREWISDEECCSPKDDCPFGEQFDDMIGGCKSLCFDDEVYVQVEASRGNACNQIAMDFDPYCFTDTACAGAFTLLMDKVDDDLMTDTYLAFRGQNFGTDYTFDCFAGVHGEDVCAMWSDYTWLYGYQNYAICSDYQGLRQVSDGCYGPDSEVVDMSNPQYRTWAQGSNSSNWCVDDKLMGYKVFGRNGSTDELGLVWEEIGIHTVKGTGGYCMPRTDSLDTQLVEIVEDTMGQGPAEDLVANGHVNLTVTVSDGIGGIAAIFINNDYEGFVRGEDPVELHDDEDMDGGDKGGLDNDCNMDTDCMDGMICEINTFDGGYSSRRLMKDHLSKFKYEGKPIFEDDKGRLIADLRNSMWSGPAVITINSLDVTVSVNYKTGHVANHDNGLTIIDGIKYDKKLGKVVKGKVNGWGLRGGKVKKEKKRKEERRKLFGGTLRG